MASDSVLHTSKGAQPTGFHCNASERVVRVDGRVSCPGSPGIVYGRAVALIV